MFACVGVRRGLGAAGRAPWRLLVVLFVVANERHNDLDGRPLCGGGAEEVLGALEGRSHVIPRDFVRLLVCLQGR